MKELLKLGKDTFMRAVVHFVLYICESCAALLTPPPAMPLVTSTRFSAKKASINAATNYIGPTAKPLPLSLGVFCEGVGGLVNGVSNTFNSMNMTARIPHMFLGDVAGGICSVLITGSNIETGLIKVANGIVKEGMLYFTPHFCVERSPAFVGPNNDTFIERTCPASSNSSYYSHTLVAIIPHLKDEYNEYTQWHSGSICITPTSNISRPFVILDSIDTLDAAVSTTGDTLPSEALQP
jgi:hypothetical protein